MDLAFAPRQIEFWPIERLRPYARNAKMHGPDQVARIVSATPTPSCHLRLDPAILRAWA